MNGSWSCSLRRAALAGAGLLAYSGSYGAGQFIEDVRVSRQGDAAQITVELACRMRFVADTATSAGVLLEIRVAPLAGCTGIGGGMASEAYRPTGRQLAYLQEVEYESLGLGEDLLLLHFSQPVDYRVAQRGNLRSITLTVQAGAAASESAAAPNFVASDAGGREPGVRPAQAGLPAGRTPLMPRSLERAVVADYIVNLSSTRDAVDPATVESIEFAANRKLYVSEIKVDGNIWYRLRLGFFESEQAAQTQLAALAAQFPRSWVGRAEPEEVALASNAAFERGGRVEAAAEAARQTPGIAATASADGNTLTEQEITALMAEARENLLDQDYAGAIANYTRVLQEGRLHRPQARENLGLARERNNQLAHARAEYQAYLREFPSGDGVLRVRQRLNGLLTASEAPRNPLRAASSSSRGRWDVGAGISQYYRRDVNQFSEDQAEIISLSAMFSDIDLRVERGGDRIDLLGRITVNHMKDMRDEQDRVRGDQSRFSYAYLDVAAADGDWNLRLGRQSLHNRGVLGRFDGVHAAYEWAPDRRVHFTSGFPVESTRNSLETGRQFYGAAIDFDDLVGNWDFSTFLNTQTIEGIADRQAIGIEARYIDERRTLTSLLDYETGYSKLNSLLVLGTWRFENRMTLSTLLDLRMSPILSTRNALIGQPIASIDELLLVWTEEEVRQLALDRTSESRTVTLGMAMPIGERLQFNADVTVTEYGETLESGGVLAIPGTGAQTYYSTSLIGSGLFGAGDVMIVSLRFGDSESFKTRQLTWDARFPIGRHLRLNPRLRLASWQGLLDTRSRDTISPSLRLLLNMRKRYRLELEIGTQNSTRTDTFGTQDASGNFFNLGYRADF